MKLENLEKLCPRCGVGHFTPYDARRDDLTDEEWRAQIHRSPFPALSRIDNRTYVCSECGQEEAMRDFQRLPPVPPDEWPIAQRRFKEVNE